MKNFNFTLLACIWTLFVFSCSSDDDALQDKQEEIIPVIKSTEYHEYVDLGLPSGTLWAAYNVGATKPEEFGSYFAWGEISPKNDYNWQTYFDSENGSDKKFKKYYQNGGKTLLEPLNDAATMNWGEGWSTPTLAQLQELQNPGYTIWFYAETKNGVKGAIVVSKINEAWIFLPTAGCKMNQNNAFVDLGLYCSSSLNARRSDCPYLLAFDSNDFSSTILFRYVGYSIRPVRMTPIAPPETMKLC